MVAIILGGCIAATGLCGFFLVRNSWVFHFRMWVLNYSAFTLRERLDNYDRLPSYDAMMWRFWVWDIKRFMGARR